MRPLQTLFTESSHHIWHLLPHTHHPVWAKSTSLAASCHCRHLCCKVSLVILLLQALSNLDPEQRSHLQGACTTRSTTTNLKCMHSCSLRRAHSDLKRGTSLHAHAVQVDITSKTPALLPAWRQSKAVNSNDTNTTAHLSGPAAVPSPSTAAAQSQSHPAQNAGPAGRTAGTSSWQHKEQTTPGY